MWHTPNDLCKGLLRHRKWHKYRENVSLAANSGVTCEVLQLSREMVSLLLCHERTFPPMMQNVSSRT
eukprot:4391661-Amphidinium_carterae.2